MFKILAAEYLDMSTVIEPTVADNENEAICLCLGMHPSLIWAWARSAYWRGAHGMAWLYTPCLVGIRLIERYPLTSRLWHDSCHTYSGTILHSIVPQLSSEEISHFITHFF